MSLRGDSSLVSEVFCEWTSTFHVVCLQLTVKVHDHHTYNITNSSVYNVQRIIFIYWYVFEIYAKKLELNIVNNDKNTSLMRKETNTLFTVLIDLNN